MEESRAVAEPAGMEEGSAQTPAQPRVRGGESEEGERERDEDDVVVHGAAVSHHRRGAPNQAEPAGR